MAKQLSIFQCFGGGKAASSNAKKTENKRKLDQQYDQAKRERSFLESWTRGRPWLRYEENGGVMFCSVCRENKHKFADTQSSFVQGTSSMRLDSITSHERSSKHVKEYDAHEASIASATSKLLPADKMLQKMNQDRVDQLFLKFRNVHAIAMHCRPFTDYIWMNELDGYKGLKIGPEYKSDKTAATFAHHIAEVEREKVTAQVNDADFACLIMDGSTDVSVVEQEMVYVRTCKQGNVDVKFVGIVGTPKADADGILASLEKAVADGIGTSLDDLGPKLVAMGTDGAAVMMGCNNGVVTKIKNNVAPTMVGIHCFAHRLELAAKDVVSKHQFFEGNLNRANLKEACKAFNVKQLVPTLPWPWLRSGPKLHKVQGQDHLCDVPLSDDDGRRPINLEDIRGTICEDLIASLGDRFDMDNALITATSIANKTSWPAKLENAKDFGDNHIKVLTDHFDANLKHANIDSESMIPEWTKLKTILYKRKLSTFRTMSWADVNMSYGDLAPNFLRLIDLVLTIPATSAEAERGFSVLKMVKTDTRNRLDGKSMNTLLRIKLLAPSEADFDPEVPVKHWFDSCRRRPRAPPADKSIEKEAVIIEVEAELEVELDVDDEEEDSEEVMDQEEDMEEEIDMEELLR
ncbi:zinc finger protein 862-like [Amphiura filiformis]|uniref:zinc finger protein 862-like n=1 Tax=Amphiura filiformis TaxID=82378 RepID=UPI003B20D29B